MKVCGEDALPWTTVPRFKGPVVLSVTEGRGVTVPVTATFCWVAPALVSVMFPEGLPMLAPVKRAKIVVDATLPPDGVSARVPE